MNYAALAIQIVAGLIVGGVVAVLYFAVLGRQVSALISGRATFYVIAGYFLRMAVIAAGLVPMLWWSAAAGIATAVGFIGYQRLIIFRLRKATPPDGGTEH